MQALRLRARQGPLSSASEVQSLVQQSLELASSFSLQDLAELAELFVALQLRLPLRDMMPSVSAQLQDSAVLAGVEVVPSVIRILKATGKAQLFYIDLFELGHARLDSMKASDVADFAYEAGRHGLRCRHFMDAIVSRAVQVLPQMNLTDVIRCWQGFIRFSRDRREFFQAAAPTVQKQVSSLTTAQLLVSLRAARDLRRQDVFVQLHAAVASELTSRMSSLGLAESANCLANCNFEKEYRIQAQALVKSVEQKWTNTEDLTPLRLVEVLDGLQAFTSWGLKPQPLTDRLDQILVDRHVELKYTGNVSLWITAVDCFAQVDYFDAQWPRVALELSRDKLFVAKVSFFQHVQLVTCLSKLRLFDEAVYRNIAELIVADITLLRNVQDLGPLLACFATAGYYHEKLFTRAYDMMIEWFEGESIDPAHRVSHTALTQACLAFANAGFHKRYESFAAFLDYAFFPGHEDKRPLQSRRLAQLADAVLTEAPAVAALCQYPERIAAARSDSRVRSILNADPVPEQRLLQDIRATLQVLGWANELQAMPDETSAFLMHINLMPQLGQKVCILAAGRQELLAHGLPQEALRPKESGHFALARRLLTARGWKCVVVQADRWAELPDVAAKQRCLEEAIQKDMPMDFIPACAAS